MIQTEVLELINRNKIMTEFGQKDLTEIYINFDGEKIKCVIWGDIGLMIEQGDIVKLSRGKIKYDRNKTKYLEISDFQDNVEVIKNGTDSYA